MPIEFVLILQIENHIQINNQNTLIVKGLEKDVSKLQKANNRLKKGLKFLGGGFLAILTPLIILTALK